MAKNPVKEAKKNLLGEASIPDFLQVKNPNDEVTYTPPSDGMVPDFNTSLYGAASSTAPTKSKFWRDDALGNVHLEDGRVVSAEQYDREQAVPKTPAVVEKAKKNLGIVPKKTAVPSTPLSFTDENGISRPVQTAVPPAPPTQKKWYEAGFHPEDLPLRAETRAQYSESDRQAAQGIFQEGQTQSKSHERAAQIIAERNNAIEQNRVDIDRRQLDYDLAAKRGMEQLESLNNDIKNTKIDPQRYIKNVGAGEGFLIGLAFLMSGIKNVLLKDPNAKNDGLEMIKNSINQDVNLQMAELDNKKAHLNSQRNLYGAMLDRLQNPIQAKLATEKFLYQQAEGKLAQLEQSTQSETALNNIKMARAQLGKEIANRNAALDSTIHVTARQEALTKAQMASSVAAAAARQPGNMKDLLKKDTQDGLRERWNPEAGGFVMGGKEENRKLKETQFAIKKATSHLARIQELANADPRSRLNPSYRQELKENINNFIQANTKLNENGVVNPADRDLAASSLDKLTSLNPLDAWGGTAGVAELDRIIRDANANIPQVFGIEKGRVLPYKNKDSGLTQNIYIPEAGFEGAEGPISQQGKK